MKIAIAQLNYHIGNFEHNQEIICRAIKKARIEKADLIVFAELAVCGYPPLDFLEFNDFINRCNKSIEAIAKECDGIAAIVGAPSKNPAVEGKDLFNSAYFLSEGKVSFIANKALLPNYDVFDEYRYFEPAKEFKLLNYKGKKIALTICEDLWDIEENLMYTICPMDELCREKPDMMINIAASPFSYAQAEKRKKVLQTNARKYKLPLIYVNHVGAQTELIFDGGSMVINEKGELVEELEYFKEELRYINLNNAKSISAGIISKEKSVLEALTLGVKDYFKKMGFSKATLGLSGGIDSALTLVIAGRALGIENVFPVLLPSKFSSAHSIDDAKQLCKNLGCHYSFISIEESYEAMLQTLAPEFKDLPFGLTEENIQARLRGVILMALSNKFGYILLNTSNKSEAAVGYGTLYGDMCGGLSVLGDLYKTEVYELSNFINKEKETIPRNTIQKPPSAELRFDQKDSDSLPEYDILDKVLYQYIEQRKSPREIIGNGFDEQLVRRVLKLVNMNEYKRKQTPPILRVSPKAFGMGRRMPIVAKYLS